MYKMIFLISLLLSWGCTELPVDPDSQSFNAVIADSLLDLENADTFHIAYAYRGHTEGSYGERSDAYGPTNQWWAEIQAAKNGSSVITFFNSGPDQSQKDAFNGGMTDFGSYTHSTTYTTKWSVMAPTTGGVPRTASVYAGGTWLPYYLDNRNYYLVAHRSDQDSSKINYGPGITDVDWISKPNAVRTEAPYHTSETALKIDMAAIIERVKQKNGFYQQFTHWQNVSGDKVRRYFKGLDSLIAGADVYRGSINTIGEYWFVRESVDSIKVSGSTVDIWNHADYPSSPYSRISTPLWVYFDLAGTMYAGNDITTSHGGKIRSMGNDKYYISVPLNFSTGHVSFDITTTGTPNYINLNNPVISRTGLSVTTDQPCMFRVFRLLKTQTDTTKWVAWKTLPITNVPTTSITLPALSSDYKHRIVARTPEYKATVTNPF
jgi:hypothetical protein